MATSIGALASSASPAPAPRVKFGVDLFSIRSQGWTPFQYLDYCAKHGVEVVHFSEIRFIGSLEEEHLKRVRAHAEKLGIEIEIGMMSICPTSRTFRAAQGTAEEQLIRMIRAANVVGSRIIRCVLGSSADRQPPLGIEGNIENTVWAIEDPHLTLETLAPYVVTSHVRDSAVWPTPNGAAVAWTRMGDGNIGIDDYVRKYVELCPGKALSLEIIVTGPRQFNYHDPKFWDAYRNMPAWEFARFVALVQKGTPRPTPPRVPREAAAAREREDLEASMAYTRELLKKIASA